MMSVHRQDPVPQHSGNGKWAFGLVLAIVGMGGFIIQKLLEEKKNSTFSDQNSGHEEDPNIREMEWLYFEE